MKWSLVNSDVHRDTAANALFFCKPEVVTPEMRYMGKQSNHALSYDMGPDRWAQIINKKSDIPPYVVVTTKQTKDYYDKWHKYYSIRGWHKDVQDQLNRSRTIITPYGRKRAFFAPWGKDLWKEAYAHIPQSTVADHCNGRVHVDLRVRGGVRAVYEDYVLKGALEILQQGHDSIIIEYDPTCEREILEGVYALMHRPLMIKGIVFTIPVDIEVGERWGETEKLKLA
jgi:DNA polymerase I-like protein with 3'-5' exonuclease and polymerase domains